MAEDEHGLALVVCEPSQHRISSREQMIERLNANILSEIRYDFDLQNVLTFSNKNPPHLCEWYLNCF